MCSAESTSRRPGRDAPRTGMMVCDRMYARNGKREPKFDADIAKNEPRSSCAWIWFDMRSAYAVSKRDQQAASWRGVGDIFSASCSTIKTSYIAIGSQKCAQHRDCSAGEMCSKAGVHGEASAPPQPRRAIFPSFLVAPSGSQAHHMT